MIKLEEVLSPENMQTACRRVIANKGAPGVDGMTVNEIRAHFEKHGASICAHIREGRYIPAAVKRVDIPKPSGGTRMLGIPTVQDRVIQQAIAQVLSKHFDPLFSEFSYGFRPGKSAHQAIEQTQKYIAEGRTWVVELDLAYGQPQSTDVETGATYRRQDASEIDPPISANGHYVRRRSSGARGRYTARLTSESDTVADRLGRTRQISGQARPKVLSVC